MALSLPKWNTFVIPVIRDDLIERCLETIYRYTEKDSFYVYLIDQTVGGLDINLRDRYPNLMIIRTPKTDYHTTGNMGFAKATNLGIQMVTTPYFTMCNDDIEFINKEWWQAVLDTFEQVNEATPDRPCLMVNPSSIKLPDWSVGRAAGDDFYIMPYQEDYSDEDWEHLVNDEHYVNEHLTLQPGSVIDGVTLYCSVIDTRKFLQTGMLDESYYPGGAEDYDYCCRASSRGFRCVGTTKSWVYHHWSSTFKSIQEQETIRSLVQDDLRMGDHNKVWGPRFDIWGIKCTQCEERLRFIPDTDHEIVRCPVHVDETFKIPEPKIMPL